MCPSSTRRRRTCRPTISRPVRQPSARPRSERHGDQHGDGTMTDIIRFTLDGQSVEAAPGETIWQVTKRLGTRIPHLCYLDQPAYRPDGNCRACMVEVEGERVLAASCIRKPAEGMV